MTSGAATKHRFIERFGNRPPQQSSTARGYIVSLTNDRLVVNVSGSQVVVTRAVGNQFSTDRTIGVAVKGAVVELSRVDGIWAVRGVIQGF